MSYTTDTVTQEDILHFLRQVYFGNYREDIIKVASERAFRDFCRTIRSKAYQQCPESAKEKAKVDVTEYLRHRIGLLGSIPGKMDAQESFDAWHGETCRGIIESFTAHPLTYGQVQKWLNMACKYLLSLDSPDIRRMLPWLHVPMDNLIVEIAVKQKMFARPKRRWSRWTHDEYMLYQSAIRAAVKERMGDSFPPIVWEFRNWKNPQA